jgi:hypothetical protein
MNWYMKTGEVWKCVRDPVTYSPTRSKGWYDGRTFLILQSVRGQWPIKASQRRERDLLPALCLDNGVYVEHIGFMRCASEPVPNWVRVFPDV